jgi:hypothetical protein
VSAGWSYERAAARVWTVRVGEPNKKLGACLRPPAYGLVLGRSLTTEEEQKQTGPQGPRETEVEICFNAIESSHAEIFGVRHEPPKSET